MTNAEGATRGPVRHVWLAGAALLGAGPLAVLVLAGRTLAWGDTARLYAPIRTVVVEALRSGHLPLWNPYAATGMPLLAETVHGALHPLSVAAAFLAPRSGMDALLVAHVALATAGAAALARVLGATRWAAAAAGAAYGVGGYVLSMTSNYVYLAGAAALPWAIAALRAAGSRGRWGIPAAAIATGLLALTGEVQSLAIAVTLGVVLAAQAGGARGSLHAAAGAALGVLLGAAQLLPTAAALPLTDRSWPLPWWEQRQFALSPWRIIEWFAPGFFWRAEDGLYAPVARALAGRQAWQYPFAPSVFIGAPVILLAALGTWRDRATRVVAAFGAAFVWVALGHHAGAQQILSHVPVWGGFRFAEKLVGPATLCAAVLAAVGVDRAAAGSPRRLALAAGATTAVGLLAAVAVRCSPAAALEAVFRVNAPSASAIQAHLVPGLVQLATASAAFTALLLAGARSASRRWLAPAIASLLVVEAWAAAPVALRVTRIRPDRAPGPVLEAPPPGPRVANPITAPPAPGDGDLDAIERDVVALSRLASGSYNVAARIDNIEPYTGVWPARNKRLLALALPREEGWRMLRRYSVTHVLADAPWAPREAGILQHAVERGTPLPSPPGTVAFSVPHRDWASFAPRVWLAGSEDEAREAVLQMYDERDRGVVLEAADESFGASPGRVLSVVRGLDRVRIEAEAPGEAVLVVNDAYWPGWTARIDGAPTRIYPADALVRAVRFPAGRHVLEMRYEPAEVTIGIAISAAAALAILALAARAWSVGRDGARHWKYAE